MTSYADILAQVGQQERDAKRLFDEQQAWDFITKYYRGIKGVGPGGIATFVPTNKGIGKAMTGAYGDPYTVGAAQQRRNEALPQLRKDADKAIRDAVYERQMAEQRRLENRAMQELINGMPYTPYDLRTAWDNAESEVLSRPGVKSVIESLGGLGGE